MSEGIDKNKYYADKVYRKRFGIYFKEKSQLKIGKFSRVLRIFNSFAGNPTTQEV
jgi:hypothetical protein